MKKKENNIVGHDCIFGIYEIIKSDKTDYDKFLELQSKYGIDNIERICKSYDDEDIFKYVSNRMAKIKENVYAFQEYVAYVKQLRASYRGELFKEQLEHKAEENNKGLR